MGHCSGHSPQKRPAGFGNHYGTVFFFGEDPAELKKTLEHYEGNVCEEAIEIRIPDCRPCYEFATERCFDCGEPSVVLGGDERSDLVFQLDFSIDDHVGETVESSIEWSRGMESGTSILEIDMADQHPDAQANAACPGLCSVSTDRSPTALSAVLLLLAGWVRRPRRTRG